ncbi:MAG: hypothetical protein ACOYL6_16265 [Bacteriovoracaceae bacterium]
MKNFIPISIATLLLSVNSYALIPAGALIEPSVTYENGDGKMTTDNSNNSGGINGFGVGLRA